MNNKKFEFTELCHCRYCREYVPQEFEETGDRQRMIRMDWIERRLEKINRAAATHWDKLERASNTEVEVEEVEEDTQDSKIIAIERKTGT